jgi:hypothetical protein
LTFISVLRLVPHWFPSKRVPMVTQLTGIVIRPIREILAERRGLALSGPVKGKSFDK